MATTRTQELQAEIKQNKETIQKMFPTLTASRTKSGMNFPKLMTDLKN
jgi:hypothetical protein